MFHLLMNYNNFTPESHYDSTAIDIEYNNNSDLLIKEQIS